MQVRVPNKTTLSYSLVELIVNMISLNITVSYKQFYQLRMEAGLHAAKCTVLTVKGSISQPPTPHGQFLDALCVYVSLLGPLFSFKRTVLRLCLESASICGISIEMADATGANLPTEARGDAVGFQPAR